MFRMIIGRKPSSIFNSVFFLVLLIALTAFAEHVVAQDNSNGTSASPESQPEQAAPQPQPVQSDKSTGLVTGKIVERGTRKPVQSADVQIVGTEKTAITDENGLFSISTSAIGPVKLQISCAGYKSVEIEVNATENGAGSAKNGKNLVIYLEGAVHELTEVVVQAEKIPDQAAMQNIPAEEAKVLPGSAGDAIRVVENMPGVAAIPAFGSYSEGLVIRGSAPEDSLYLLDGHYLPQLFHFGGLISIVNQELIEDIAYYPGGYGVKYGQAIGGVIELTSRKPRTDRFGGIVDVSTYSAYALMEGPAGKKCSYAAAVRRSFIDFVLPAVVPQDQMAFTVVPRFYDYTAIFDIQANDANRIHFLVLGSDDRMGLINKKGYNESDPLMGNEFDGTFLFHRLDISWTYKPSADFTNELSLSPVYQAIDVGVGMNSYVRVWILNQELREDASLKLGSHNKLGLGASTDFVHYNYSADIVHPPKEGQPVMPNFSTGEFVRSSDSSNIFGGSAYFEDQIDATNWFSVTPGIRADYYPIIEEVTFDPRLFFRFLVKEKAAFKLSAGIYHQMPQSDEILKKIGNPNLQAEVSYQTSGGFSYDFGQGYYIDTQGYFKWLEKMVSPTEPSDAVPYRNTGKGHIWGAELLLRKRLTKRFFGWLSYSYSVSRRQDRPDADWRYFDMDQTHTLTALASYKIGDTWRIGGRFRFSTGLPYTPIVGSIYSADADAYLPIADSKINEKRNPPMHQLDLRVDKAWIFNRWVLSLYLDVQNVYFQRQPLGYMYNYDYTKKKPVSYPSFMPSIGTEARF